MTDKLNCTETLETLIDQHGLFHVLVGLECVCDEKGAHIAENWQDARTARKWASMSKHFLNLAKLCEIKGLD
jgi:hypothetical protein